MTTILHLLHCKQVPILQQLQWEEALLRTDTRNVCLINEGSPPAIVLGRSLQPEEWVSSESRLPLLRRFSGGGTVVVDENTLFITFLFNHDAVSIDPFPESILRWSEELYAKSFQLPDFCKRENDFCIGEYKVGGNAHYLQKGRWLQHTTFLWDYNPDHMQQLRFPPKTPLYRQGRSHSDFIARLKEFSPSRDALIEGLKKELSKTFSLSPISQEEVEEIALRPHRKTTQNLSV